jgi:hypothetical protein
MLDQTAVSNAQRLGDAAANAAYLSAHYAAKVDALADHLVSLPVTDGQIHGITAGYASGDLTFTANWYNGVSNPGEFTAQGTEFTLHASAGGGTLSLGDINLGIAAIDSATGTGYLLYSVQSVQSRFSTNPPAGDNSDHLISVRYHQGQWQYATNTDWYNFTPVASDVLIAAVDFENDTVSDLGGFVQLPWASFEKQRAEAEADAWETVKSQYLDWQAAVADAYAVYALARGNAYLQSAQTVASAVRGFQETSAVRTQSHVVTLAQAEYDFQMDLADLVSAYREETAWIEYQDAVAEAKDENYDPDFGAVAVAYQGYYLSLERSRRLAFARSGHELSRDLAQAAAQQAQTIAAAQAQFDETVADAYFAAGGGQQAVGGLEGTLAQLAYDYDTSYSETFTTAITDLAETEESPWSVLAAAEADARHNELVLPLAEQTYYNRMDLAAAENAYQLAIGAAGRNQWLASVNAQGNRAVQQAVELVSTVGTSTAGSTGSVELPDDLAPPCRTWGA